MLPRLFDEFGLSPVMASLMEDVELTVNDANFATAVLCTVAGVIRDYGMFDRAEAPSDSTALHG